MGITMSMHYDRQGKIMDNKEWVEKFGDDKYKTVAVTKTKDITISTVWLGLDHSLGHGKVLIFGTMVFGLGNDEIQERYTTEEEALNGHKEMVKKYL